MQRHPEGYDTLLVEDDPLTAEDMCSALQCLNFSVAHTQDAKECLTKLESYSPELILLDLGLPEVPGYELCRILRQERKVQTPIIILSGTQEESEIVLALEAGADDFVPKSSSFQLLLAHIRAVMKRFATHPGSGENVLTWGELSLNTDTRLVTIGERTLDFTEAEERLLQTFLKRPGAVFTRAQLISAMHGEGYRITERTIDVHINSIRNQLGNLRYALQTVRGVGYRFAESPM